METRFFTKLLAGILISLNIQGFSEYSFSDYGSTDSTFQKQDSLLQIIWKIDTQTSSSTSLIVTEDKLFTTTENGLIQCFLFNGQEKWTTEVLGSISKDAVQYKDLFLTATNEGDLYSINSNNGDIVQVIGVGENITTDLSLIDLASNNSNSRGVVFGTDKGNIFCYDIFSFERIWEINLSSHALISKPAVVNDKIIFKNSCSSLFCVNAKSGLLIWKYEIYPKEVFDSYSLILTNGQTIFTLVPDGKVIAIDLLLGKKLWSSNAIDIVPQFSLLPDMQKFILSNKNGMLVFISTKDGKEIQKIDLMKSDLFSFIVTENKEHIFVGLSDGSLYNIDSKYSVKQLISQTNNPITSINVISKDGLIIKDLNGKITFYKTK